MTNQSPDQFENDLHNLLAACGVALVIFPHFPKTYAHGATFWMGRDKAVMMMTIRYSWADIFWFTLFHEIGHLLKHKRQLVILEGDIDDPEYLKMENWELSPHHTLCPSCHPESLGKIEYQTSRHQYSYLSCLESRPQNA
jgi:HTH-type transcriptional regulator / antitoxin HigA